MGFSWGVKWAFCMIWRPGNLPTKSCKASASRERERPLLIFDSQNIEGRTNASTTTTKAIEKKSKVTSLN